MKIQLICSALALGLVACGQSDEADHAGMTDDGGHAMPAEDAGMVAALPNDGVQPVIAVRTAWMRPHPQGRDVTAAYFQADLTAGLADRLVAARIDGASHVELHGHSMDEQGMMRMRPIGPQVLDTEGPLVFTPGGRHLMVHGLAPVSEGETVRGVLVFERAGEVAVEFAVQSMPPSAAAPD